MTDTDITTLKYDRDDYLSNYGTEIWERRVNGTSNNWDSGSQVEIAPNGTVYVTGSPINAGTSHDVMAVKYLPSGLKIGPTRCFDRFIDFGGRLAVDANGDFYVGAVSWDTTGYDYLTIKYQSSSDTYMTNGEFALVSDFSPDFSPDFFKIQVSGSMQMDSSDSNAVAGGKILGVEALELKSESGDVYRLKHVDPGEDPVLALTKGRIPSSVIVNTEEGLAQPWLVLEGPGLERGDFQGYCVLPKDAFEGGEYFGDAESPDAFNFSQRTTRTMPPGMGVWRYKVICPDDKSAEGCKVEMELYGVLSLEVRKEEKKPPPPCEDCRETPTNCDIFGVEVRDDADGLLVTFGLEGKPAEGDPSEWLQVTAMSEEGDAVALESDVLLTPRSSEIALQIARRCFEVFPTGRGTLCLAVKCADGNWTRECVLVELCAARFELGFEPSCGEPLVLLPGTRGEIGCTLTSQIAGVKGASGWAIGIVADGVQIVDITTQGTVAADVNDLPAGLRDGGFEISELTSTPGNNGAVSAVVLSLANQNNVTLPPNGTETIARLIVAPLSPVCTRAKIAYVDGLKGSGEAIVNAVNYKNDLYVPVLGSCAFEICPGDLPARALSYDCNNDGRVDISDVLCHLGFLFMGRREPACREAMDFNGDGREDITDGVGQLTHMFRGGPEQAQGKGCKTYKTCARSLVCDE